MRSKSDFPKLQSKALLSPMAGVTNVAFRSLAASYGCGLTYTEFVNSTGLVRQNPSALKMIATAENENPVAVQLFGSSVNDVIDAAHFLEDRFDVIDINCGCPAWKVVKTGAGSELLKSPEKIGRFVSQLVDAIAKPVTVKIRAGIDDRHINAVEVARIVEDCGAAAIAIHGRTQKQGYRGLADWSIIRSVKDSVNIPVIGNGDVTTPEKFKECLEYSNVDAIMIARGAIGNPYLFAQINDYMKTGSYSSVNRVAVFFEYLKLAVLHNIDFSVIRQHALTFTKGVVGGAKLREKLTACLSVSEIEEVLEEYK